MSRKKRDTMLSAAFATQDASPESPITLGTPLWLSAAQSEAGESWQRTAFLLHSPSHRFMAPNNYYSPAQRGATRTYVKGYSQSYQLKPNSNDVWWHRRICFSVKKFTDTDYTALMDTLGAQQSPGVVSWIPMRNLSAGPEETPYRQVRQLATELLFRGTFGIDYVDYFLAKIDTTRVNLHSDRIKKTSSGNNVPNPVTYKFYDSINKSIVYDDEESGILLTVSPNSVESKPGIGDLYVLDMFHCPMSDSADDDILISSNSTYYWHERN